MAVVIIISPYANYFYGFPIAGNSTVLDFLAPLWLARAMLLVLSHEF